MDLNPLNSDCFCSLSHVKINEQTIDSCYTPSHIFSLVPHVENVLFIVLLLQVAGNFHFAPGKSYQQHHIHGESGFLREENVSHGTCCC